MAVDATCTQPNNPPEVLFVSRYFYPFVGGLEKRVYNLARALTARGYPGNNRHQPNLS